MMAESESSSYTGRQTGVEEYPYEQYESDPENKSTSCGVDRKMSAPDWMSVMGERFFESKVGEVVWPGTHDSGAYCQDFDYEKVVHHDKVRRVATHLFNCLGPTVNKVASEWSQTQTMDITSQLEHGIRYLDLRVSQCLADGCYYIVHSFCGPSLEEVLSQIGNFMNDHQNECLLLEIDPVSHVDHSQLHTLVTRRLNRLLLERDCDTPMCLPLSHLIAKGRIVVLYKQPSPETQDFWDSVPFFWNNKYIHAPFVMSLSPNEKEQYQLEKFSHFVRGYRRNQKNEKLFHFMYALTPTLSQIVKGSLWPSAWKTNEDPVNLQDCAQKTNTRIDRYFEDIKRVSGDSCDIGLIFSVDFVGDSNLMDHIVMLNSSKIRQPN